MIFSSNPKFSFIKNKKNIFQKLDSFIHQGNYINSTEVNDFEKNFAKYIGVNYCAAVGNATDALYLSMISLSIGLGDEVITVSHTATATITAILRTGAKPVFCDISEEDFNINLNHIEKKITPKTRAIIPVHLYGQSCDMNKLVSICSKNKIYIIEDCSQAAGAKFNKKKIGSFGLLSCFSFFPTKNLSTFGDGGCVVSNNLKLINKIKSLREYGWDKNRNAQSIGINSRLDEIHALILNLKLKQLDKDNLERRKVAKYYFSKIKNPLFILPKENNNTYHVYHLFVVRLKKRKKFIKYISIHGFKLGIHYALPVHKQKFLNLKNLPLPVTDKISNEVISLPIYPGIKKLELNRLVKLINSFN